MRFRSLALLTILAFAIGCASGNTAQRPANIPRPEINSEIASEIFFAGGSSAPVTIDVSVKNSAAEPITVRRIEMDTPDMTEWGLMRQSRSYEEVIEPGETKKITFFGTARPMRSKRKPVSMGCWMAMRISIASPRFASSGTCTLATM